MTKQLQRQPKGFFGCVQTSNIHSIRIAVYTLIVAMTLIISQQALAAPTPVYQPFIGRYLGRATLADGKETQQRDLSVTITALDDGFRLAWETIAYYNNKAKTKHYSIAFKASQRTNIYRSAMKKNLFGAPQPLDPMKGEPYIWARFKDNTMTVYALLITDDGGYEFQVYDRTLTKDGLQLSFRRIRNHKILKTISARLLRQQ